MKTTLSFFSAALVAGCAFAGQQLLNLPDCPEGGRFKVPEDRVWPEKPGDADICLWHNDRFAACSVVIDDNFRIDHEWWLGLGEELGVRFTWFVITDGIVKGDGEGTFQGSWSEWQKLADAGHSIQSQTTNHRYDPKAKKRTAGTKLLSEEELTAMYRDSLEIINANITNNFACTIAYPNGDAHPDVAGKFAIACRGERTEPNAPNAMNYLDANRGVDGIEFVDAVSGKFTTTMPQWLASNGDLKRGLNVVRHHFVHAGKSEAERAARAAKIEKEVRCIAALKDDLLWVCRFDDAMKYAQERDTAKLTVTENTADAISFELSDDMKDGVFSFPLTVKVRLPDDWKSAGATQGGKAVGVEFTEHDGAPFALVHAVPDNGTVKLVK